MRGLGLGLAISIEGYRSRVASVLAQNLQLHCLAFICDAQGTVGSAAPGGPPRRAFSHGMLADLKAFGYYHKLGKCKTMYQKAHELAKADPTKVPLLVPLPRECKDCITV